MPTSAIEQVNPGICIAAERARAALEVIPIKFRKQIVSKINGLGTDPHPASSRIVHGAMDEGRTIYRIRSGRYRVLYSIRDSSCIAVLDVDHRKDVHRRTT